MALGDISVINPSGQNLPAAIPLPVVASATLINPGEPVVVSSTGVVTTATSTPTTSLKMIGIAQTLSTNTASLAGSVDVLLAVPGLVYSTKALVPANINTLAKLAALIFTRMLWDLTTGVYTVNESTVDNAANGLLCVGGDITNGTISYLILQGTTELPAL